MRHSRLALPGLSGRSHSALALPMFLGVEEALATRDWHCQGMAPSRLSAPPVKWPHKRYEPNRKEHPMFTELCIAFYTVMTLGIASAFLFTHAQQAK